MNDSRFRWALLLLWAAMALPGCGSGPVAAPTGYADWNATDGTFRIDYPEGWDADGGGRHGVQWATFKKGSALIDVSVSFGESVMGDILGAGGSGEATIIGDPSEADEGVPPVAIIHSEKQREFARDYGDYVEQEAIQILPPLGEGRKSEFTGTKGFSKVHGYRTSILSSKRGITIICQCAETDWAALQPAFDRILDAVTLGSRSH